MLAVYMLVCILPVSPLLNFYCREYYSRLKGFLKDLEHPEVARTATAPPPTNGVRRQQQCSSSKSSSSAGAVASSREKADDKEQRTVAGEANRDKDGQQEKERLGGPGRDGARSAGATPAAAVRPPAGASTAVVTAESNSCEHQSKPDPCSPSINQNHQERHPNLRLDTLDRSSSEWGTDGELKAELEEVDLTPGAAGASDDGDRDVDSLMHHGGGKILGTATMSPQSPLGKK